MSTVPAPIPVPRPRPNPSGPAGPRPTGPAGAGPTGRAAVRPQLRTPVVPPRGSRAHLERLTRAFVVLFCEVEAGRRPPRHLAPLLSPLLYARLSQVWFRGGQPGTVATVRVLSFDGRGCDAVAVVRRGSRCGAISLHLRPTERGGWIIDQLARPEDGPLPPPPYPVPERPADFEEDDAAIPAVARPAGPEPAGQPAGWYVDAVSG